MGVVDGGESSIRPDMGEGAGGRLAPWVPAELPGDSAEGYVRLQLHSDGTRFTLEVRPWPWITEDGELEMLDSPVRRLAVTAEAWEQWLVGESSAIGSALLKMQEWRLGHDYAVKANGDVFGGVAPELALADLNPIPVEIGDSLDRAEGAQFVAYAWGTWAHWRGDFDLVAHIGRVATEFLEGRGLTSDLKIEIGVRQDTESFDTAEALTTDLTDQARRSADWACVTVRAEGCSARIVWASRGVPAQSLENTVLLECESSLQVPDLSERWRDRLAKAIDRGRPPGGSEAETGNTLVPKDSDGLQRPFRVRDQPATWLENWGAPSLVWFLAVLFAAPIVGSLLGDWGAIGTVALVSLLGVGMLIFYPGVELGPRSNSSTVRKLLVGALASSSGVAISLIVKDIAAQLGLGG